MVTQPPRAVHRTMVRGVNPATEEEFAIVANRAAGPERATARRAEWRVSQANGVSARRLREMNESGPERATARRAGP